MHEGARVTARKPAGAKTRPAKMASAAPVAARAKPRSVQAQMLQRQKTVGNQAVQKLMRAEFVQQTGQREARAGPQAATQSSLQAPPRSAPGSAEPAAPQPGQLAESKPLMRVAPSGARAANEPRIHRAWYNFDIPFTNYQFDPSIEGIKTAAGVVKDTAVSGFEWVVDEIKSAVSAGIDWLTEKWDAVQEFASSAFDSLKSAFASIIGFVKNPLGFLADALMNFDGQAISKAWSVFSGLLTQAANGFKALTDSLLGKINAIWSSINSFASSLLGHVEGLIGNFLFKKLPDALQRIALGVVDKLKALWKKINDGWTALFNRFKAWIDDAIDKVFSFVRRVMSFGINVVIAGIVDFGKIILFLKDLFTNPAKYVGLLAERSVRAFDGVESRFTGLIGQYFGAASPKASAAATPDTTVHRAPGPAAPAAEPKTSASWGEIGHGISGMMGKKWEAFKSNPMAVVKGLLMDLIFPIIGNIKDVVQLVQDIKKVVTAPLSAGSLEELWTSFLQILDIPIMIYHTVVSILMRTLMLPLIVATFIPHPVVKGIAAAVGYALLGAFVQAEVLNLAQKLLLLKTGRTTGAQKEEAYNRISDSLIALAMAAVITLIMLILHFIANVMKGVYGFIKGKVFSIEPVPGEGKGTTPPEAKPTDAGGDTKGSDTKPAGTTPDNPDRLVICRVCDEVKGIPKDLMDQRAKLTPEARARLDQTAKSIFKDPANPTEQEFNNLGRFMKAMEERGGGDLQKGLEDLIKSDAKKNAPSPKPPAKPPFGSKAAELPKLRAEADALQAEIDDFAKANPDNPTIQRLADKLRTYTDGPIANMENGLYEATDSLYQKTQGSLRGMTGELETAKAAPKGTLFSEFIDGYEIDQIHPDGTLKQVKNWDPFPKTEARFETAKSQLTDTLKVAQNNPVNGNPRPVVMEFPRGVNADVAAELEAVTVNGQKATILGTRIH